MRKMFLLVPVVLAGCVIYERPREWIPAREPLTPERLAEMKREGRSDSDIRRELEYHGVAYKLNADDLIELKEAGAGQALLTAAAAAPVKTPREARPVYERRTYYHSYPYYPYYYRAPLFPYLGASVSFNYTFGRHRHRHSRW